MVSSISAILLLSLFNLVSMSANPLTPELLFLSINDISSSLAWATIKIVHWITLVDAHTENTIYKPGYQYSVEWLQVLNKLTLATLSDTCELIPPKACCNVLMAMFSFSWSWLHLVDSFSLCDCLQIVKKISKKL